MIMNLGLHLDAVSNTASGGKRKTPEEIEIRRRLFWGAFVSEKLQSLYLGRPFIIHESDTHVPKVAHLLYLQNLAADSDDRNSSTSTKKAKSGNHSHTTKGASL